MAQSLLLSPLTLASTTLRNRTVVSPMCTYSARNGVASDWHRAHYGRFALGGAGLVTVEATGVLPEGRITHGCLGIWSDEQIEPMRRLVETIQACGSAASLQIAHAGRKGSSRVPLRGGAPLTAEDAALGDPPWRTVAPSAIAANPKRLAPDALDTAELAGITAAWAAAARRADRAGFDTLELHGAHGYLLHSFLSPISNRRDDAYGGTLDNRMRFPLEVAAAVRGAWRADKPLLYRISAEDGDAEGWTLGDTVLFARALKAAGLDVIVCSSGGIDALKSRSVASGVELRPGYQVPFAERVRREAGIATMAVGLIVNPHHAEAILRRGQADLIALGRQFLDDPNWPLHAGVALGRGHEDWPETFRWSLSRRASWAGAWQGIEDPDVL